MPRHRFSIKNSSYGEAEVRDPREHATRCQACGAADVPTLVTDSSSSEYAPVELCRACIGAAFDAAARS